jgi:hypothetical protein
MPDWVVDVPVLSKRNNFFLSASAGNIACCHTYIYYIKLTCMTWKIFLFTWCFIGAVFTQAQVTAGFNSMLPTSLVDPRGDITRSVMGMDFMVRVLLYEDVKNLDACSDADYGRLSIEIMWYDEQTELGKSQIDMIALLNAAEQQKVDFLGQGNYTELAGGSMVLETSSAPCVNTISGETGQIQHATNAKFFMYNGAALVKIAYSGKLKSGTVTEFIAAASNEINKFDFAAYKNVVADEQE